MLVSGVQQSDSVIRIHVFVLFQILLSYSSSQNIEYSSRCYTVGPSWLSTLCMVASGLIQAPDYPSPLRSPFGNHKFVSDICKSVSVLQMYSFFHFSKIRFHL